MTYTPSNSVVMHNKEGDDAYIKEIVSRNEALFIEVEQLRLRIRNQDVEGVNRLRVENTELRQRLQVTETQLAEQTRRLDDTRSETSARCAELERQRTALTTDMMRVLSGEKGAGRASREVVEDMKTLLRQYVVGGDTLLEMQRQVGNVRENSERDSIQRRIQTLFSVGKVDLKTIKGLFEEILDYQQRSEEEKNTAILIKQLKLEDMKKTYERDMKNLQSENKSLRSALGMYKEQVGAAAPASRVPDETTGAAAQSPAMANAQLTTPRTGRATSASQGAMDESRYTDERYRASAPVVESCPVERHWNPNDAVVPAEFGNGKKFCPACTLINPVDTTRCNACGHLL